MWGSTCCHICCLSVYSLTSKQRVGLYVLSRLLFVCVQFDIQAVSVGLYVLSYLLFVCVQFDIQAASGALRAVTSVVCLCTV